MYPQSCVNIWNNVKNKGILEKKNGKLRYLLSGNFVTANATFLCRQGKLRSCTFFHQVLRFAEHYLIKHGVKTVRIRSYSGRIFPGFSRIRTEYGEVFSPNGGNLVEKSTTS